MSTPEQTAPGPAGATMSSLVQREDFLATSDPALQESADRGVAKLLDYTQLYHLWERQQWVTQDLDFTQDRADWAAMDPEERFQRMYGLSAFFIGEQKVTDELGPIMRACPTEEQRIFLSTQIADEARHVRFFNRFYEEVGVVEGATDGVAERLAATEKHLNPSFHELFDGLLKGRVDRLATDPENTELLVESIALYHLIIEGVLALTGQHFIISYNEEQGTLPGFVEGFQKVARDEHRHIAFGVRFLTDMARAEDRYREAIQRTMAEALPVADGVIDPPYVEPGEDWELFGISRDQTHAFAAQCLTRRLKVIGLAP